MRARFDGAAELYTRDPRHFDTQPEQASEAIMGDIVRTNGPATLSIRVDAPAPIERIDILRGPNLIHTHRCYETRDLGNRVRVYWCGAEYRGRGRNTRWQGEVEAMGAAITAMQPVNCWNHERPPVLDGNTVRFDQVTSGNYAGVDLMLDQPGTLAVRSNLTSGEIALGTFGIEDAVLHAGGLHRQILVRRLPDTPPPSAATMEMDLTAHLTGDDAIWARVTTMDGHQAWSSPIYLFRG